MIGALTWMAATVVAAQGGYSDVPPDAWFAPYVQEATRLEIVSGYKDASGNPTGRFGPSNPVTIAEALKMAVVAAGYDAEWYLRRYEHGEPWHWVAPYYTVASARGFKSFPFLSRGDIDAPATRGQVAQLIVDAFQEAPETFSGNRYADVSTDTPFALSIEALSRDGVVSGDTDANGRPVGRFRPLDFVNRAETVKMIIRARAAYGTPGKATEGAQSSSTSVASASLSSSVSSVPMAGSSSAVSSLSSSSSL